MVDTEFKRAPRERAFRAFKSKPKAVVHANYQRVAIKNENWYAAAFHAGWYLHLEPGHRAAYDALHSASARLEDGQRSLLPDVVRAALDLPIPR